MSKSNHSATVASTPKAQVELAPHNPEVRHEELTHTAVLPTVPPTQEEIIAQLRKELEEAKAAKAQPASTPATPAPTAPKGRGKGTVKGEDGEMIATLPIGKANAVSSAGFRTLWAARTGEPRCANATQKLLKLAADYSDQVGCYQDARGWNYFYQVG